MDAVRFPLMLLKEQVPETKIVWVLRKAILNDVYGGQENDALRERGVLGSRLLFIFKISSKMDNKSPYPAR